MTTQLISESAEKGALIKPLLFIVFIITIIRAYLLSLSSLDLYVDEIQYWWWSLEMDWGFYSKPPMIAALIHLVTSILGHSVYTVKLGAILVYPLTTYIVYLLGRKLISENVGFWAGVLFITLPGVALSSTITSTDVLLFLFWGSAMLFFIRSIESNSWFDWVACGVICGLGLLTKYNMAVFAVSAFAYMLFFGNIQALKNPRLWMMAAISLLILAPNIYWNYLNDFPTFSHTAEYVDKKGLYPNKMLSFIFEQAAIIGPVGFILMWWWMLKGDAPKNVLVTFSLPIFVVICGVALQGKYNANWAAPMYVGITIGVAHFLQHRKGWLIAMLATNILLGAVVQLGDPALKAMNIELSAKKDPFKRVRGWKDWGENLKVYTDQHPDMLFIAKGRDTITEATFYTFGMPNERVVAWSPGPTIKSHFELTRPFIGSDKPSLFLSAGDYEKQLTSYFTHVQKLAVISRHIGKDKKKDFYLYKVDGFLGYKNQKD